MVRYLCCGHIGSSFGLNCVVANPRKNNQVFLTLSDLSSLRETSRLHSTCEWFGLGWTVVLSPLIRAPSAVLDDF